MPALLGHEDHVGVLFQMLMNVLRHQRQDAQVATTREGDYHLLFENGTPVACAHVLPLGDGSSVHGIQRIAVPDQTSGITLLQALQSGVGFDPPPH